MLRGFLSLLGVLFLAFSAVGQECKLTNRGVLFRNGSLELTMTYPALGKSGQRPLVGKVQLVDDKTAHIDYGAGRLATITMADGAGTMKFTNISGFRPQVNIAVPLLYGDGGKWEFNSKSGAFPKTLPEKHILFGGNGGSVVIVSPGGEQLCLKIPGYFQLQDNRRFKWNTYMLEVGLHQQKGRTEFGWEFPTASAAPRKALVDKYGQFTHVQWDGKVLNDEDLLLDVQRDREYYGSLTPPATGYWGGMAGEAGKIGEATGFFRVEEYNGRKVLVDPEGRLFFQLGVCTVGSCDDYTYTKGRENIYQWLPKPGGEFDTAFLNNPAGGNFSFYKANWIRKTGKPHDHESWQREMLMRLRKWGFNSQGAFGSVSPKNKGLGFAETPGLPVDKWHGYTYLNDMIMDPFHQGNRELLDRKFAEHLKKFQGYAGVLGFFSGNERHYNDVVPALLKGGPTPAKAEFLRLARQKYGTFQAFEQVWQSGATNWDDVANKALVTVNAKSFQDMRDFEMHFYQEYFGLIYNTLRKYDQEHLYLGERFLVATTSNNAALMGCAKYAEVFSVNYYAAQVDMKYLEGLGAKIDRPLLLSEWSYGSPEQGQLGVIHTNSEAERGMAYRRYVENVAANSKYVVGVQWFAFLDQAVTGRYYQKYNGEAMNIGLLNVADRPYKTFLEAVMKTNYQIYQLLLGEVPPVELQNAATDNATKVAQAPRMLPQHRFDGSLTGWPGRPTDAIQRHGEGMQTGKGWRGDFRTAWDDEALYIHVTVVDDTPATNTHTGTMTWSGDAVEIFMGKDLTSEGAYVFGDFQLIVAAGPSPKPNYQWYRRVNPGPVKALVKVNPQQSGYVMELAIPWKEIDVVPKAGLKLRFDVGVDFGGDRGNRLLQLMWSGSKRNNSHRTDWGTLVLVD